MVVIDLGGIHPKSPKKKSGLGIIRICPYNIYIYILYNIYIYTLELQGPGQRRIFGMIHGCTGFPILPMGKIWTVLCPWRSKYMSTQQTSGLYRPRQNGEELTEPPDTMDGCGVPWRPFWKPTLLRRVRCGEFFVYKEKAPGYNIHHRKATNVP